MAPQELSLATLVQKNPGLWERAWEKTVGKGAVIRTNDRLDSMVKHLGYESVPVEFLIRDQLSEVIKTDKQLVREMAERLSRADTISDSELTFRQLAHLNLARAIAVGIGQLGSIKAAIIPPASLMVGRTAGLYEFDTANIKISAEILQYAGETVGVMVHEGAHHVAYRSKEEAGDLTPGHADAMEFVAGHIFSRLEQGKLDEYLKECVW
jgi:hypothetical protein